MTTTQKFNGRDYFNTPEEAQGRERKNTNPRYPTFFQSHFTAGDEQQFETYRNRYIEEGCPAEGIPVDDIYFKYCNVGECGVSNTFKYMFHKFKKGIFIQIKEGELKVMLPFSKHAYTNEWSHLVKVNPQKYKTTLQLFERVCALDGRPFNPKKINKHMDQWYANGSIFRYEHPVKEFDASIDVISHMFTELCREYPDLPNIEFFVNKRDHPLMRRDGNEPYASIYGDHQIPIEGAHDKYAPILSMCSGDAFADIAIPTWDDWARVCALEGKYFPKCAQHYPCAQYDSQTANSTWHSKINIAVFRGSSTGGLDNNMRIKIARMTQSHPSHLNAGITSWNVRPRITNGIIDTFDDEALQIPLVEYLSLDAQALHKYIVNIDGHVSAYRLSSELGSGSVVLIVESKFKLWFSDLLVPYTHYVPIAHDLSDLIQQIEWCRANDASCEQIASNAKKFYDTHLCKSGILRFLRDTIVRLKGVVGTYVYCKSIVDIIVEQENKDIEEMAFKSDRIIASNPKVPKAFPRTFDLLEGIRIFMSSHSLANPTSLPSVNKKTKLSVYVVDNFKVLGKSLVEGEEETELVNESIVGLKCVNNILKYIPNFVFTFGFDALAKESYSEFVDGAFTLYDYIVGNDFSMDEYLSILQQLSLAIHVAQQMYYFMHNDLYPWNVLIKRLPRQINVHYLVNGEYVMIQTRVVPIIIDYGKSRVILEDRCYGVINPSYNSTIHDVLCIIISSMHTLIDKRRLSKEDLRKVFFLAEFFSGSTYTNHKYFKTIHDLKHFLSRQKKYAQIISIKKHELESKVPFDFVCFLKKMFGCGYTVVRSIPSNTSIQLMRAGTWRQVYECLTGVSEYDAVRNVLFKIVNHDIPRDECSGFAFVEFKRIIKSIAHMYPDFEGACEEALCEIECLDKPLPSSFSVPSTLEGMRINQFLIDHGSAFVEDLDNLKILSSSIL